MVARRQRQEPIHPNIPQALEPFYIMRPDRPRLTPAATELNSTLKHTEAQQDNKRRDEVMTSCLCSQERQGGHARKSAACWRHTQASDKLDTSASSWCKRGGDPVRETIAQPGAQQISSLHVS